MKQPSIVSVIVLPVIVVVIFTALAYSLVMHVIPDWRLNRVDARRHFDQVKDQPTLLRSFLQGFPKGGDLHNHLAGAVYAENYIRWAAEDGKCLDLDGFSVTPPPCARAAGRPPMADVRYDAAVVNQVIDAFSIRNHERRPASAHNHFFSTFEKFDEAADQREGHMLAAAAARAATQNILYLELMQSYGMSAARRLATTDAGIDPARPMAELVRHEGLGRLAEETISKLNRAEAQRRTVLSCDRQTADPGCDVAVRYLAQVIRVFPLEQVLAQTLLAFMLMEKDPRYAGLNFVAPEDHPIALKDYRRQMEIIGELARHFPNSAAGVTLHAGEITLGLAAPEHLGWHIRTALDIAGARRIGHGVDIAHDAAADKLMERMAEEGVLVEINLSSNAVILGVEGERHPFQAYREHGVPLALSTDDEGVFRIDLTHEYQRAVETYDLSYRDLKELSRNALAYSFLEGRGLLKSTRSGRFVEPCRGANPQKPPQSGACRRFLEESDKAALQWELEGRLRRFEERFAGSFGR